MYEYEYEYEYEDYEDGEEAGGDGDEYELSSPPPTLSQLVPPTQSLEDLLPKGTNGITCFDLRPNYLFEISWVIIKNLGLQDN